MRACTIAHAAQICRKHVAAIARLIFEHTLTAHILTAARDVVDKRDVVHKRDGDFSANNASSKTRTDGSNNTQMVIRHTQHRCQKKRSRKHTKIINTKIPYKHEQNKKGMLAQTSLLWTTSLPGKDVGIEGNPPPQFLSTPRCNTHPCRP